MIRKLVLFLLAWPGLAAAAVYHVDAVHGDDARSGLSTVEAWRSLAKLRSAPLKPGDQVLLAAGSVWREPLVIIQSGSEGAPILVGAEGAGERPRIEAGGVAENAVEISNAEYVTVTGLEVTNNGPGTVMRRGVLVVGRDFGVLRGITISDLYIHDVNGTNARKDNGGIVFWASGIQKPTRFEGITIERNIIWRVDRSGIAGISDQVDRARWFPSRFVVIRDNYLEDIGGDGIVPRGTDGALIEHNIVRRAASRAGGYNVAIWQWSTDNSLIQLNEAAFTHGVYDGQGFDSDFNSRRTRIVYNFSHDNDGGFLLVCSPVARNDTNNLGNIGTVVQHNVSWNDHARIFQLGGASDALIAGNVIHVAPDEDVQMVVATQWDGWSNGVLFRDNQFKVAGTARYGHEVGRDGGHYLIGPGFQPATDIRFSGNAFFGRHIDEPEDGEGRFRSRFTPPTLDWDVPQFDPARPGNLAEFMARHRDWMMRMLTRELGERPRLEVPQLMGVDELRRP
jgi:hypothetical protein